MKNLACSLLVVGLGLMNGAAFATPIAELTISDQNNEFTITHSSLLLTLTATGMGSSPITVVQGNADGDTINIANSAFSSFTITQGTGVNDQIFLTPESMIGGVFNFTGTWALSAGSPVTVGSFAEVAYGPNGSISDLLTWTVASAGTDEASITGTFCANLLGTGSGPCNVPTDAVAVGQGPNFFGNQNLTATWTTDRPAILPEPNSIGMLCAGLFGLALTRRRRG
jgi:hypothetical protein